jgi:hypothetical protein
METGQITVAGNSEARKRESFIYGWVGAAAREYWNCVQTFCYWL